MKKQTLETIRSLAELASHADRVNIQGRRTIARLGLEVKAALQPKPVRLTRLTKREDALYQREFADYCNNVRNDAARADRAAWRVLVEEFPRLRNYDGAEQYGVL